jgi:hypothetical protein
MSSKSGIKRPIEIHFDGYSGILVGNDLPRSVLTTERSEELPKFSGKGFITCQNKDRR